MNTKSILSTTILAASCFMVSPVMALGQANIHPNCGEEEILAKYPDLSGGKLTSAQNHCTLFFEGNCDSTPTVEQTVCDVMELNYAKKVGVAGASPIDLVETAVCPAIESWTNGEAGTSLDLVGESDVFFCADTEVTGASPQDILQSPVSATLIFVVGNSKVFYIGDMDYGIYDLEVNAYLSQVIEDTTPEQRDDCRNYLKRLYQTACNNL